jgi:hypothetical protein
MSCSLTDRYELLSSSLPSICPEDGGSRFRRNISSSGLRTTTYEKTMSLGSMNLLGLRFSQWWVCRLLSSGIWCRVVWSEFTGKNVLPPPSVSKSKPSITGWLGIIFNPENGGSTFVRNFGKLLPGHMTSHPRRSVPFNFEFNPESGD